MRKKISCLNLWRSEAYKLLINFVVLIFLFCATSTAMATNFKCKKNTTPSEKIICSEETDYIAKLSKKVAASYAEKMKHATKKEKKLLIKYQKHWLKFTYNRCKNEDAKCLSRAYWSRIFDMSGVTYKPAYKTDENELKKILKTAQFYPTSTENTTAVMCQEILNDLKQAKEINFVKPKLTVLSYEDTALDTWKQNCKVGQSLVISPDVAMCANFAAISLKFDGKLRDCPNMSYGIPPISVFEIPTDKLNKQHTLLYWNYGGFKEDPLGDTRTEAVGSGDAGFFDVDVQQCKTTHLWTDEWYYYRKLLKLKDKYYFVGLIRRTTIGNPYDLTITPIDNVKIKCDWSTQKTNP
jgi:uncharacterized protein